MASCPYICFYVLIWWPGYEDDFLSLYLCLCVDMRTRLWQRLLVRISFLCADMVSRLWRWFLVRISAFMYVFICSPGYEDGFLLVYLSLCVDMVTRLWGWLLVCISAFMCWYEGQAMMMASYRVSAFMCWFEGQAMRVDYCPYVCVYVLTWGPDYEDGFLSVYLRLCVDMRTRLWEWLLVLMSACMCWYGTRLWGWLLVRVSASMCWYGDQAIWSGYMDGILSVYLRLCVYMRTRLWGRLLVCVSAFMCWFEGQAMRMDSCLCICVYVLIWWPGRLWGWLLVRRSAFMCWYEIHANDDGFLSVYLRLCVEMRTELWRWLLVRISAFMCRNEDRAMRMASCPYICVYVLIWGPGYEDGFLSVYLRLCVDMLTRLWGWDLVSVSAFMCRNEDRAMRMASCPYVCFYVLIWWPGRLWRWVIVRISAFMCWFEGQAMRTASYRYICVYVLKWGPSYEDGFLSVCLLLCVDMVTRQA